MKKTQTERLQQRLIAYTNEYEKTKKLIHDVGFIMEGSLVKNYSNCGKKNCRCQKNRKYRHGPYYQLTWKEKGKTVTRYLSNDIAQLYREWIDNRQKIKRMISKMNTISVQSRKCICAIRDIKNPQNKAKKLTKSK